MAEQIILEEEDSTLPIPEEEVIEEIIRVYGYDKIPSKSIYTSNEKKIDNRCQIRELNIKRSLVQRGLTETISWSFMSNEHAKVFGINDSLEIENPISNDLDVMRPSIIPNLLDSIQKNQGRLLNNAGIFEVGPQYENFKVEGQHNMASGIKYGTAYSGNWNEEKRFIDVFDIKSDIFNLLFSF